MEILELIGGLIEGLGCLLEGTLGLLDLLTIPGDVYAWYQSRGNRRARRLAKRQGMKPPTRSAWTVAYNILLVVSTVALLATLALVAYRLTRG